MFKEIDLGDKELDENVVSVRERRQGDVGAMTLEEFSAMTRDQKLTRSRWAYRR